MGRLLRPLRDRNVIMLFALATGLAWGGGARWTQSTTLPVLAAIMTIATINVRWEAFYSLKSAGVAVITGIGMTYVVQALALIGTTRLFIHDDAFRVGFIILAAVPPAVAVIPFTLFVKGDNDFSVVGTIGAYLGALVMAPLIMVYFVGPGFVDPRKLIVVFLELIIAPIILARILVRSGISSRIEPFYGTITNWGFFLLIYTMVGLNRDVFLDRPAALAPVILVGVLTTFTTGWIIEHGGRMLKISAPRLSSIVLLATFKNYGLAGGIALVFFDVRTMVPATVTSVLGILYIIRLELRAKKKFAKDPGGP
jgi:bile acid:Na+ symporter, BASS family